MNKFHLIIVTALTLIATQSFADGATLYKNLGCAGCHGANGKSTIVGYPSLAGKSASYIVKQLENFQSGVRKNGTMNAIVPISAGHEQEIADYLATQ